MATRARTEVEQEVTEFEPEDPPETYLGVKLAVQWSGNRWYNGVINDWDEKRFMHHVLYTDGDKRWYKLAEKTFRLHGTDIIWHARAPGTYPPHQTTWIPYTPKDAKAATPTEFKVVVQDKLLQAGEFVTIHGSVPALGNWGANGVPLIRDEKDANLWTINIEMPFAPAERCQTGIFEFKYAIEGGAEGIVFEGNRNRRMKSLRKQFYATLRADKKNNRFDRHKTMSKENALSYFARLEYNKYLAGDLTAADFLVYWNNIKTEFDHGSHRKKEGEKLVDELLELTNECKSDQLEKPVAHLALLGLAGSFGLTSEIRKAEEAEQGWKKKDKRKPNPPNPWCRFMVDDLDINSICAVDLKTMGPHWRDCVVGLREAAERICQNESYNWLRVIPFLKRNNNLPSTNSGTKMKKRTEEYNNIMVRVKAMANDAFAFAAIDISQQTARNQEIIDEAIKAGNEAPELEDVHSVHQDIAEDWLRALVSYAPNIDCLATLFDQDFAVHAKLLKPEVGEWIRTCTWNAASAVMQLASLAETIPDMRSPFIAASMLRCYSANKKLLWDEVLKFTALCCEPQMEEKKGDKKERDQDGLEKMSDFDRELVDMENAAKEWFRRNHADPPPEPKDSKDDSGGMFYGFYSTRDDNNKKKKKMPTKAEMAKKRLEALTKAIDVLDSLMKIEHFNQKPQGLLFELSRCFFLKGDPSSVLQSICSLGSPHGLQCHRHLSNWLSSRGTRILEEVVPAARRNQGELIELVDVINNTLPKHSPLSHSFLYSLAAAAGGSPPSLTSILQYSPMWTKLFTARGTRSSDWGDDTPLNQLLANVYTQLTSVAGAINSSTVGLRTLHNCLQHHDQLLPLLALIRCNLLDRHNLADRRQALADFDQTLAEVQVYLTRFCSTGVKIDANDINDKVGVLTQQYDGLRLMDVKDSFGDLLSDHGTSIQWLYSLRDSELFYKVWHAEGHKITNRIQAEIALKDDADDKAAEMSFGDEKGDGKFNAAVMNFVAADEEVAELTQEQVVKELIPTAKSEWAALMASVRDRTISIHELEKTFSTLKTSADYDRELKALASTGDGEPPARYSDEAKWLPESASKLRDYSLLVSMQKWLPAMLNIRTLCSDLITTPKEDDPYYQKIDQLIKAQETKWDEQTLDTLSQLVEPVKAEMKGFTVNQMDFLSVLSECEGLVNWLLEHNDTAEFNRLLEVCRPNTDEPVLLSSIASLVQVRTMLLPLLNRKEGFAGMQEFLNVFCHDVQLDGDNGKKDLLNIQSTFEGLLEVFEKQTRSPGIKSCYEIRDIAQRGVYQLQACNDHESVLFLEMRPVTVEQKDDVDGKDGDAPASPTGEDTAVKSLKSRTETLEYLLDLRSKIMMTEIPEELEEELNMGALVDNFVQQLQLLVEMKDEVFELYKLGHFQYQEGWEMSFPSQLGLEDMQSALDRLRTDKANWIAMVSATRDEYYFLNYFTMRELLRITHVMLGKKPAMTLSERKKMKEHEKKKARMSAEAKAQLEAEEEKSRIAAEKRAKLLAEMPDEYACNICTLNNPIGNPKCAVCGANRPAEYNVLGDAMTDSKSEAKRGARRGGKKREEIELSPLETIISMMHLVASTVDEKLVEAAMVHYKETLGIKSLDNDEKEVDEPEPTELLRRLGQMLNAIFTRGGGSSTPTAGRSPAKNDAKSSDAKSGDHKSDSKRSASSDSFEDGLIVRKIPPPGPDAKNLADMMIHVEEEDNEELPVWVAKAESPVHVIEVVLSVYVRRGRLPEPGEIVFCSSETTLEEISLLFRRFIRAKAFGRSDCVFCLADVHALSYTMQVAVVEKLRNHLADYGTEHAASLLLVSGLPRQVLLNSLSSQAVVLEPLDIETLRVALARAAALHCGETLCITSSINGGGKTHYLMNWISKRQKGGEDFAYRRIPYREASTPASLVSSFSSIPPMEKTAFHLDIGHIIPANANTVLFELLIVGVLKNSESCKVYHRKSEDLYAIEIPNSQGDKTAQALRFLSLLPTKSLVVSADTLDRNRPIFTNDDCTTIGTPNYDELSFVCKVIRAFRAGKFRPGATWDAEWDPWLEEDPSNQECFDMLSTYCAHDGHPSWLVFYNFLRFMYAAFTAMQNYELMTPILLQNMEGLTALKDVFCNLLIETSKDFTLRAVPRGSQFGKVKISVNEEHHRTIEPQVGAGGHATGFFLPNTGGGAAPDLLFRADSVSPNATDDEPDIPEPPVMRRTPSAELAVAQAAAAAAQPALVREMSNNLADRFSEMVTWEDTEHPIVMWYWSRFGDSVDGLDILSLNDRFVDNYFDRHMKAALICNMIPLDRDWRQLTSEEGIKMLQKVEGLAMEGVPSLPVDPIDLTYVVTVDNLLKMISIQLRMKNNLPVMIMGETGCGKSSLIRQLCAIIRAPLRTLNIHGGMEDDDIISWMEDRVKECMRLAGQHERLVVFLDEVNTCNSMGLFKEIVCDQSMNGVRLPDNMKIIAACNPYRLKKGIAREEEKMAGLIFDHHSAAHGENVGTGIKDPLKNLVYRVHPLPESMIDHVFDFGSLAPETERLYIKAILRRQLSIYVDDEKKDEKKEGKMGSRGHDDNVSPELLAALAASLTDQGGVPASSAGGGRGGGLQGRFGSDSDDDTPAGNDADSQVALLRERMAALVASRNGDRSLGDAAGLGADPSDPNDPLAALTGMTDEEIASLIEAQLAASGQDQDPDKIAALQASLLQTKGKKMTDFGEFVEVFADLICAAQEFIRTLHGGERSVVSLRDVARCVTVYRWFGEHFAQRVGTWTLQEFFAVKEVARRSVRQAVILALGYCYHARLPRDERRQFRKHLQDTWENLQAPIRQERQRNIFGAFGRMMPVYGPRATWLKLTADSFNKVLWDVQRSFVSQMNLGEGIALNEALLENLFMILVSVLNKIPIFVIGKPGSSKSLAMGLVQSNLNGDASENAFLRSLPAVEVFSYQCSPLSTSGGIEQAFEAAARYKQTSQNTVVVVLLDEVGLAEQSPHLPLKVLHKVLDEDRDQAVVGISNWALDPAKMNRAVHLYRPAPTVEDLSTTAEGMVQVPNLRGYLQSLARAYSVTYHKQVQPDFWGLREFYSTVKHINRALQEEKRPLDGALLSEAVLRNFGGRPTEMKRVMDTFFKSLNLPQQGIPELSVVDLIRQNLYSPEAATSSRHLMLLTKNNAALGLLFDNKILQHGQTEVIFGSDFPLDQTDLQICLNIQRVKYNMAEGITVVLVYCESLYESLYDLLNQHYTEYGGQLYVRLAFGTHSRLCPIHRNFRIVVVVEKLEAYTRLAPPLLNRFEKQVMEREHVLRDDELKLQERLEAFAALFVTDAPKVNLTRSISNDGKTHAADEIEDEENVANLKGLRSAFSGFHSDMLSSLAQSIPLDEYPDVESRFQAAARRLLWVATPEAVCRVMSGTRNKKLQADYRIDVTDVYFKQQRHGDLPSFCAEQLTAWSTEDFGAQVAVVTFSPLSHRVDQVITAQSQWKDVSVTVLHELSSERDLTGRIDEFFSECKDGSVFVLQCDPLAASNRRIEHAKYIIENARAKHIRELRGQSDEKKGSSANVEASTKDATVESSDMGDDTKDSKGMVDDEDAKVGDDSKDSKGMGDEEGKGADSKTGAADEETQVVRKATGVHVILLIHMPRNESGFCLDFDLRWRFGFVDSIKPARTSGLPNIQSMLGRSMEEIFQAVDLRQALLRSFRVSMSRLVYLHERNNEDVRKQIMFLLDSLQTDGIFVAALKKSIGLMVKSSGDELDLMAAAQKEDELVLAGTFQAALHRQIQEVISNYFAVLLAHMDRNSGLYLVGEEKDNVRDLWLYLFTRSSSDFQILNRTITRVIEVPADGINGNHYSCRFPFSFYIAKLLGSMRATTEIRADPEVALSHQFSLLNLELGLDGVLSESLIRRYIYDFACMNCMYTEHVDADTKADILWSVLRLYTNGEAPKTLPQVHARFWMVERTVHSYLQLIDSVPAAKDAIVSYLLNDAKSYGPSTNFGIVNIVLEVLTPKGQGWEKVEDYHGWMASLQSARPTISGLVSGAFLGDKDEKKGIQIIEADEAETKLTLASWEKMRFYFTFIRDIAVPLMIDPQLSLETMMRLDVVDLRTKETFRILIKMLGDLNREYSRAGQDVECNICFEIPTDPVRFCALPTCSRLVCKPCAEEWLASDKGGACFWCREPNPPGYRVDPNDAKRVMSAEGKEQQLRKVAVRFMEFFIFEFCLSDTTGNNSLEQELVEDFITMLAKKPLKGGVNDKYHLDVVPSDAGRVALLRDLIQIKDQKTSEWVYECLIKELDQCVTDSGHLDTPLSVCYASVQEEILKEKIPDADTALQVLSQLNLDHLRWKPGSPEPVSQVLTTVAQSRRILIIFAELVCELVDSRSHDEKEEAIPISAQDLKLLTDFHSRLEPMFTEGNIVGSDGETVVRSVRMFLLKNLERMRGVSFVRSALQQAPFAHATWLQTWKAKGEPGLLRFLGDNKLPRHNPFTQLFMWNDVLTSVGAALAPSGGNTSQLKQLLSAITDQGEQVRIKGALMAAAFHEGYLLNVLPDVPPKTIRRCEDLRRFIQQDASLNFCSAAERNLIAFFAGNKPRSANDAHNFLSLHKDSSPEHIALVRLICHVGAVAISSSATNPLTLFNTMITQPHVLIDTFLPCMPEDVRAMAVRVLGGRWYKCPNGHAYYVDKCGRPTVIQKCATCNVDIGGTDHNLLDTNQDIDEKLVGNTEYSQVTTVKDNSEAGFCFNDAKEEKDPYQTVRSMPPVLNRALRLLVNSAMCLGCIAGGQSWVKQVKSGLFNKGYATPNNAPRFFVQHVRSDWKVLKKIMRKGDDDIALLLHAAVEDSMSIPDTNDDEGKILRFETLRAVENRNKWEEILNTHTLGTNLNASDVGAHLESVQLRFSEGKSDEGAVFLAELMERTSCDSIATNVRAVMAPALWRYRRPFSLSDFKMELNLISTQQGGDDNTYPVLNAFLSQEEQLRALRHLPQVIEWQSLLMKRYNRVLDQKTASEKTVQQVIDDAPDKPKWQAAFAGYKAAWNMSWKFVERFGCLQIPAVYKQLEMSEDMPISFSFPTEKDEGICPLTLIRFLGETHNRFVERVDELLLMRNEMLHRSSDHKGVVSSKFFGEPHALIYDIENGFLPFVEKQCVEFTSSGNVNYNFENAEEYLMDVYFKGKPLIDLEIRMIQWANAEDTNTYLLKQKVDQEPLTKEIRAKILEELGNRSAARQCLELVETCISFLQATGGTFVQHLDVGDKPLGEYTREVLMMDDAEFGSNVVASTVCLKHIDSLWQTLRDFTIADPFAKVRPKYREELEAIDIKMLTSVIEDLDTTALLPIMKEFMVSQLTEEHIAEDVPIKMVIGACMEGDAFLSDLDWFIDFWPDDVMMCNFFEAYKLLSENATA